MVAWQRFSDSSGEWIHKDDAMFWRRVYPGHGRHIAAARKFPALLLADTGCAEDAEWIASELISNAIKYTRSGEHGGWFGVEISRRSKVARIAVSDLGGGQVPIVGPRPGEGRLVEHGHGLLSVAKMAVKLGVEGNSEGGHTVWAELDMTAEQTGQAQ